MEVNVLGVNLFHILMQQEHEMLTENQADEANTWHSMRLGITCFPKATAIGLEKYILNYSTSIMMASDNGHRRYY